MKVLAKTTLRETRIKKGFTLVSFAAAIGTTKQMVGQVERRANGIAPDKALKAVEVLGVEFDDIFELVEREGKNE